MIQFNSKSILKVHPLNFAKFLIELKRKLGQSSVNGLLNTSSSVDLCHCDILWKLTLLEEKCSSETISQDNHCHGYVLIRQPVFEHGLPPA